MPSIFFFFTGDPCDSRTSSKFTPGREKVLVESSASHDGGGDQQPQQAILEGASSGVGSVGGKQAEIRSKSAKNSPGEWAGAHLFHLRNKLLMNFGHSIGKLYSTMENT